MKIVSCVSCGNKDCIHTGRSHDVYCGNYVKNKTKVKQKISSKADKAEDLENERCIRASLKEDIRNKIIDEEEW